MAAVVEPIDPCAPGDASAWEALVAGAGAHPVFLAPTWFRLCLAHFGSDTEARLLAVREQGRLIGVAPLVLATVRLRGLRLRRLGFLRAPDTPFADLLVEPGSEPRVAEALSAELAGPRRQDWDVLDLEGIPEDSPVIAPLERALARDRLVPERLGSTERPFIAVRESFEAYLAARSSKFRKTARNIENRMARLEGVEVRCHANDPGSGLEAMRSVAATSWKGHAGLAVTSDPRALAFLTDLAVWAARAGSLRLWVLTQAGRPLAFEYGLACKGVFHALRADFDEDASEHSPGAYLQSAILRRLHEERFRLYDTGPGANPYKLHAADGLLRSVRIVAANRTTRGRAWRLVERRFVPALRRARRRLDPAGYDAASSPTVRDSK